MDAVMTQPFASTSPSLHAVSAGTRAALDGFFRAFGFSAPEDLSRLADWALDTRPGVEPHEALVLARVRMEAWLMAVLGPALVGGQGSPLARGRAAFVLSDGARWGARAVTQGLGALSLEQVRVLRDAVPVPAPRPMPTTMPEQRVVLSPLRELLRRFGWRAVGTPDVSVSR